MMLRPGLILKPHPGSRLAFEYFCFRSHEMVGELDAFSQIAKGKQAFMDIGALHGLFSLVFKSINEKGEALAFDPSPIAFQRLLYNVHKNDFQYINPFEIALSNEEGQLEMSYVWEHLVANSDPDATTVRIPKRKGDDICAEQGFIPDLIKIDVEGHEWKVIQGLDDTISKHHPLIFLELHPDRIEQEGDSLNEIFEYFYDRAYKVYSLQGQEIVPDRLKEDRIILSTKEITVL